MHPVYVLVTPARNEEACLPGTIESIVKQTVLPARWIIVSDGSTDRTDQIVSRYAEQYPFIQLLRQQRDGLRNFGSKVHAFRKAQEQLHDVPFDYIGNLDADVTFAADYFESVLSRFEQAASLGVAGGIIHELVNGQFVQQRISADSVAGAVQFFQRECFEAIGGYRPLRYGGVDAAAEVMARMKGWKTQTFPDLPVQHHRPVSSGEGNMIRTKWRHGYRHYHLGFLPLYEFVRSALRFSDRPFLLGSILTAAGFTWASMKREKRDIPAEVVAYLQKEQRQKLFLRRSRSRPLTGEQRSNP